MSITKCPGHMRSLKLNFSATVLTLGLKAKIFENLRLCQAKFWGELRTRPTFDRCVVVRRQRGKITSGDVMTRVPVRLSRRSLAFYYGKVPGFTYSSLREYKSAVYS